MICKPYHPANVASQPFPAWRVIVLAWVGKAVGVQFKIDGIPYGASYRPDLWGDIERVGDGLNDAF